MGGWRAHHCSLVHTGLLPCWVGMDMAGPTSLMTQTASNENHLPRPICMFSESGMGPAGSPTVCP